MRFKVTTANGKHGGFRTASASFTANENLPAPGEGRAPGSPPGPPASGSGEPVGEDEMNGKFVAHGWLMALAWAVLIPFGIFSARYARSPPGAPPARSDAVETVRRAWFQLHIWLNSIGLVSALIGGVLSYSAVEEELGDGMHLRSAHAYWGAATLLLGLNQPLNAFTRPPRALARGGQVGGASAVGEGAPRTRLGRADDLNRRHGHRDGGGDERLGRAQGW